MYVTTAPSGTWPQPSASVLGTNRYADRRWHLRAVVPYHGHAAKPVPAHDLALGQNADAPPSRSHPIKKWGCARSEASEGVGGRGYTCVRRAPILAVSVEAMTTNTA